MLNAPQPVPNKIPTNQIRCPTISPSLCFHTSLLKAAQQRHIEKQVMKMTSVDNCIWLHKDVTYIQKEEQVPPWTPSCRTGQRCPIIPTASKVTRCKATSGSTEAAHRTAGSGIIYCCRQYTKPNGIEHVTKKLRKSTFTTVLHHLSF